MSLNLLIYGITFRHADGHALSFKRVCPSRRATTVNLSFASPVYQASTIYLYPQVNHYILLFISTVFF